MPDMISDFARALAGIAHDAGQLILEKFRGEGEVRRKADESPVTDADEQAESLILQRLAGLAPGIPVIAEEAMARSAQVRPGARFFLVDPLDGTEEFVSRRDEFTVNIALIENGAAVCGVLIAPAKHRAFIGEKGNGACELFAPPAGPLDFGRVKQIRARPAPAEGATVLVSRTHRTGEAGLYGGEKVASVVAVASSLKFGLLAAGEADLYPRTGPTMEWDIAAGHALLEAAGGSVRSIGGGALCYGKADAGFRNPGFIARGAA